ncbi:MAG: hypothetical protein IKS05_02315 [Oscillospiraceae bacterium]|nr:hypothetical protein [Oscillospiraceae bacterium]
MNRKHIRFKKTDQRRKILRILNAYSVSFVLEPKLRSCVRFRNDILREILFQVSEVSCNVKHIAATAIVPIDVASCHSLQVEEPLAGNGFYADIFNHSLGDIFVCWIVAFKVQDMQILTDEESIPNAVVVVDTDYQPMGNDRFLICS